MLHTKKIRLFVSQCASWQTELIHKKKTQGRRGYWTVDYTGTQSFVTYQSYSLTQKHWVIVLNQDWLVPNYKCPNLTTNNFNLQKG